MRKCMTSKGAGIMVDLDVKKNSNKSMIRYLGRMIAMTAKALPFQFWINIPASLLHSISFILITIASEKFYDKVALLKDYGSASSVVKSVLILGAAYLFNQVINGLHNYMYSIRSTKLIGIFRDILHRKASAVSPVLYEDPLYLDRLEKAKKGTPVSIFASDLVVVLLTFYFPYFVFMSIYLGSKSNILLFVLILIFAPVIVGQVLRMRLFKIKEDKLAPLRREMENREKSIFDRQFFKETRLLGIVGFMNKLYLKAIEDVNNQHWKTEKKSMTQMIFLRILVVLGYIGILCMLVYLCLNGQISIGSFMAIFGTLGTMFSLSEEIVSVHIGSIAQDAANIQNLIDFLAMEEDTGELGTFNENLGIELKDVHFRYPGAKKESIKGINLSIKPGEVIAVVGDNGAGKSTLVKLIAGLYKPSEGKVEIGGLNTSNTAPECIYRGISAVFQKFKCYNMTLGDNIIISDSDVSDSERLNRINKAIEESEIDMSPNVFSNGIDTMISREFDGVELSGGQWQRIAIARGLYRKNHVIILDEPTAAIDPIEETKLYKQFAKISKGKTALIVTHRLGSTRVADLIIVMKDGLINDIGTYEELMERDGLYAEMYKSQAMWYQE